MKRFTLLALLALTVVGVEAQAPNGTIKVKWNPVADASGATIAGYNVCSGPSATQLTSCDQVGKITETVMSGLTPCATYFVGVKARDTDGDVSASWSNIISGWPAPQIAAVVPATGQVGRPTAVTITGSGFAAGSTLAATGATVTAVTSTGCGTMTATITPTTAGSPVLTVTTSGVVGRASGLFQAVEAVRPGDVSGVSRGES